MAKINLKLSPDAEDYLRKKHNEKRGDMGEYVSDLILKDKAAKEAATKGGKKS